MPRQKIALCLRNRLFSECLALALDCSEVFAYTSVAPEGILASLRIDHRAFFPIDLLLLDAEVSQDMVDRIFEELRQSLPSCKVLLLVSEQGINRMVELARLGGHGCLFENVPLSDVHEAVSTVLAGRSFCSPQLANSLLAQVGRIDHKESWSQHLDGVQLTSREREILGLISRERLCNKQIARRLSVSLYTIKNHVHNMIEKLGAQDRYDAVEIARRRKMLTSDRPIVASGAFS